MSVPRVAIVLLGLCIVGLAAVQFRAQRTQLVHEMQRMRTGQLQLHHELWELQLEKARLAAPSAIRERAERLSLDVIPPHDAAATTSAQATPAGPAR